MDVFPLLYLQNHTKYKWTSFLYCTCKATQNTNERLSFIQLAKLHKIQTNGFPLFNLQNLQNTNGRLSFVELTKPHKIRTNVVLLLNLRNHTKYK